MKFLVNIFKKYFSSDPQKILGRWNVDSCVKKINYKIDLSNEDHCGPCGQYKLESSLNKRTKNRIIYDNKSRIIKLNYE